MFMSISSKISSDIWWHVTLDVLTAVKMSTFTLKMQAGRLLETSVLTYKTTWCHIPEGYDRLD